MIMKKHLLSFCLLLSIYSSIVAQSYDVQPIVYLPFSFNSGTPLTLADDQYSGVIPIGFDFCFFGQTYNSVLISSNSYITFNLTAAGGYCPWSIPGPVPGNGVTELLNSIMCPWQDLLPPSGGTIKYFVFGQAPCRRFVVSYSETSMFSCTTLNFSNQLVLYESSNVIETYIASKPICTSWNSGQAIHGLQNADGSEVVIIPGRNAPEQWEAYNDAYRFIPLTCGIDSNACPFITEVPDYTLLKGKVFIDSMANCGYESDEFEISNEMVTLSPNNWISFTDSNGDYSFYILDTGNYQVNFNGPQLMQVTCTQGIINIPSINDTAIVDLPIESLDCASILNELDLLVVRPCSTSTIYLSLENHGTNHSGIIYAKVLLPTGLTFVSASLPHTTSGDTLMFMLPDGLFPSENAFISIASTASCNLVVGDTICAQSWVDFENTSCTNTLDGLGCTTVVNSYDPNDKRFSHANHILNDGYFTLDTIMQNDSLIYMIRFQNTGTAVANDVRVMDEFPYELDMSTFEMLAASHAYQLSIAGRNITWTFENIMLPDSLSDPVNSIGFVKFGIRHTGNILPFSEINNHASIFFDFNPPVITDTAVCVLGLDHSSSINSSEENRFTVYPNPSAGQITIAGNTNSGDKLLLFDVTGRMLRNYTLNEKSTTLDIGEVSAGVYTFTITDSKNNLIGNGKIQLTE